MITMNVPKFGSSRAARRRALIAGAVMVLGLFVEGTSFANNHVMTEGVGDYSNYCLRNPSACADCPPDNPLHCHDTICDTEAQGFHNYITATGTGWAYSTPYYNASVYDTDFYDPDVGTTYDNDTNNFDRAGNAISYVCAHGVCDDIGGFCLSGCSTGGRCNGTPPGSTLPYCVYNTPRRLVTSGAVSHRNDFVFYGQGQVKWGEDAASGAWAGAGANGGSNVVVMTNSCSQRAPFWNEVFGAFAGIHVLANIMVVNANSSGLTDAANYDLRGFEMAYQIVNIPNQTIAEAWFTTMDSIPQQTDHSAPCPDVNSGNWTYGGGHAILGCGGHLVTSVDATATKTNWHVFNESWIGAQAESNDAIGGGVYTAYWHCNYDCATYPW